MKRPDQALVVTALAVLSVLVALGVWADPDPRGHGTHEQFGLPPCPLYAWTDVPCPSCGVTTAVVLAVQGRPLDSIRTQPFGFLLTILALGFAVFVLAQAARRRSAALALARRRPWRHWRALAFAWLAGWLTVLFLRLS